MNDFPYKTEFPVENLSTYRKGGYHPVHIGDRFKNNRYRVIHKLGYGSYSTVWLAKDETLVPSYHFSTQADIPLYFALTNDQYARLSRFVALKIVTAESGIETRERRVLRLLTRHTAAGTNIADSDSNGAEYVVRMLDEFTHTGPNGTHACLVLDVLGPDCPTVCEDFPDGRMDGNIAKRVSMQMLKGLAFMHRCGIGHGGMGISSFATSIIFSLLL